MGDHIESGTIKVIEVIGVSTDGFGDAIDRAVAKAAESVSGITGVEVQSLSGGVRDGSISSYRATVKIAFVVS